LQCNMPQGPILVAIPPAELERSLWRLLSLMAGAMAQGDRIALQVTLPLGGTTAQLTLPLPAALAMREDTALAAGGGTAILGTGFALRLVAAEIRCAGGQFAREDTGQDRAELQIVLPLLTAARQRLSQSTSLAGQAG
jgi:two-component system, OmpR family, sensor kinase